MRLRAGCLLTVALLGALIAPLPARASDPPSLRPGGAPTVAGLKVLAGNLHDHTTDSDGDTASAKVVPWFRAHHRELGVDFETLSDHSDFFPLAPLGPVTSPLWNRQAKLLAANTTPDMTFLRGFEWTNDQENHLNVIGSRTWTSRFVTGDAALNMHPFWTWLSTVGSDGVGQFNHPGDKGFLNWDNYDLDAGAAEHMATIEVVGDRAKNAHDLMSSDAGWYWYALTKGWNVSPTMNFDFHDWAADGVIAKHEPGRDCGVKGYMSCQRTLVLARANTRDAILDALRHHRTSASELPDLWATLRGPGDTWQGSTAKARPGDLITLTVDAGSATQELQSVDIVDDGGIDPHPFYDGDNPELQKDQFTPSLAVEHARYRLTNGHTTLKRRADAPPGAAVIATVPLRGHRVTQQITVRVPAARSLRPDGKHFFYAIVHATPPAAAAGPGVTARAWTGPLFTTGGPVGRWISGDTHVHDDHSSDGSSLRQGISQGAPGNVSVADQIHQTERMGLGFLPLTDHRTYDQQWDPLWTSSKLILVPGEEANGSPHANVHGAADELVDGANPPGSAAYRHIQQSIWDVHAQDASWQTNHPDDGEWSGGVPNVNANAVGADTVEVWNRASDPDAEIAYAENRWNAGYRFGVTGASDDHFKELWAIAGPGNPTTYVFAPTPTERGIVAGLRAGHTTVSANPTAPMLTLTADVDGDGAYESMGGDEVTAVPGRNGKLKVRVQRGVGTTVLVYAAPGASRAAIATFHPTRLDESFTVPLSGTVPWYRAEVRGVGAPAGLAVEPPNKALLAIASPLFVDSGVRAVPRAESPLPARSTTNDGAVAALETPQSFTGWSDVAAPYAVAHVVAEADAGGVASVVYSRLGGARLTLSDPDASARFPAIAAQGHDVWVVWQEERGNQMPHRTNIVLRHSPNDGLNWDEPRQLTTDGHAQHPVIDSGVVAWADNAGGAFDVYVRDLVHDRGAVDVSAAGKQIRKGNPVDTRAAIFPASVFPSLAVRGDGRVVVAWADNRRDVDPGWSGSTNGEGTEPDDWEIYTASRGADGKWSAPLDVSNDPNRADRHPSLAFTGNGQVLVAAWDSKELKESGVNVDVRFAQGWPDGTHWTGVREVGFDPNAMSEHPVVAAAGPGARIVWHDSRAADWRWSIWSASLLPNGASPPTRLTGTGNALYPSVDGSFVAFTSDRDATRLQRDGTQGVFVIRR